MSYEPVKQVSTLTKQELAGALYAAESKISELSKEVRRLQETILKLRELA